MMHHKKSVRAGERESRSFLAHALILFYSYRKAVSFAYTLFVILYSLFAPVRAFALVSVGQDKFEQSLSGDQFNKESFDFQATHGLLASMNVFLLGCTSESSCPESIKKGAVHGVGNAIAALYTAPPASGVAYAMDVFSNFGITKPAYAQEGSGFTLLNPILDLWKAFRNLAYIFFVILFIAIGFAIMFRVKLSPQTVVTIQSALPRIVIVLLLITFSYAIAGLLIDLMYVIMLFGIHFLASQGLVNDANALIGQYYSGNFLGAMGAVFGGGAQGFFRLAAALVTGGAEIVGGIMEGLFRTPFDIGPGGFIGRAVGGLLGGVVGGVASVIVIFLLALFLIFVLIRLFFLLLISYISILLLTIFGPIMIILGILPAQMPVGPGAWFKQLLANILVFPLTAFLLIIGTILAQRGNLPGQGIWTPPLMLGATGEAAQVLIGLGILFFIPNIINGMKAALQAATFERGVEGITQPMGRGIEEFGVRMPIQGPLRMITTGTRWQWIPESLHRIGELGRGWRKPP